MSKPITDVTAERLRELLDYDAATGEFTYRVKRGHMRPGDLAGGLMPVGYVQIYVDGKNYLAHRLAWLHVTGAMPERYIDHRDTNKSNNRFTNLRDVSEIVNGHNRKGANKNNLASGLIGVRRNRLRWAAQITVNRKPHHLGTYDTPEQAHAVYLEAKRQFVPGLGETPLLMGSCS